MQARERGAELGHLELGHLDLGPGRRWRGGDGRADGLGPGLLELVVEAVLGLRGDQVGDLQLVEDEQQDHRAESDERLPDPAQTGAQRVGAHDAPVGTVRVEKVRGNSTLPSSIGPS